MKTFEDLVFQEHALAKEANQHKAEISVIKDCPFLTDKWKYECAVLKGTEEHYHLVYPKFTDGDIMRMNTQKEINELMKKIQELPNQKD